MRNASICASLLLAAIWSFGQPQDSARKFEDGNSTGIPVYPKAIASEHTDDRGTVSLVDRAQAHSLAANAYISADKPEKVLQFYRERLKNYGQVVECSGGENHTVDVELNDVAFASPTLCRATEFAADGTELKVISSGEQRIVVVLPHGSGSEIALVRVHP